MNTIYKYQLEWQIGLPQTLLLPRGSGAIRCELQDGQPTLWVIVDTEEEKVSKQFIIHGTGHYLGNVDDLIYISTIFSGAFVWHVFEILP